MCRQPELSELCYLHLTLTVCSGKVAWSGKDLSVPHHFGTDAILGITLELQLQSFSQ